MNASIAALKQYILDLLAQHGLMRGDALIRSIKDGSMVSSVLSSLIADGKVEIYYPRGAGGKALPHEALIALKGELAKVIDPSLLNSCPDSSHCSK